MEEEKPAAGEKPDVPSKGGAGEQQQTPPPPDAKPQSKKRTADEAGLPSEAPPAKAADSKAEDFSKLTVAQLKDKLKGASWCALLSLLHTPDPIWHHAQKRE